MKNSLVGHALGLAVVAIVVSFATLTAQTTTRTLQLADYYRLKSVGGPAISPDGNWVAYAVTSLVEDENRSHSEIWIASTDDSSEPRRLTTPGLEASNPT